MPHRIVWPKLGFTDYQEARAKPSKPMTKFYKYLKGVSGGILLRDGVFALFEHRLRNLLLQRYHIAGFMLCQPPQNR
jgi:hypothetical protein